MGSWNSISDLPAGHVPSGAELLAWSSLLKVAPESSYVEKGADETVTTSTTLSASHDADLQVLVAANATYRFWIHLIYNSSTTADIKGQLSLPAGATAQWMMGGLDATATTNTGVQNIGPFTAASVPFWGGTGGDTVATPNGRITTSSTAGTFQFQWAQNTSSGSTIVRAGSHLWVVRVA